MMTVHGTVVSKSVGRYDVIDMAAAPRVQLPGW